MDWKDKVILITGATGGIGSALAWECAVKEAIVVCVSRSKDDLEVITKKVQSISPKSMGVVCDVRNAYNVRSMVHGVLDRFGRIDILMNVAGVGLYKDVIDTSLEEYEEVMQTNYFGTVYCTKEVLSSMMNEKSGTIVNISSVAGKTGFPLISAYAASKFAVAGFTESLFYDLRDYNIRVHLICPGAVNTKFFDQESYKHFPHEDRHANMVEPEVVARGIFDAMEKNRFETFIPNSGRIKNIGKNILTQWYMKKVNALPR